MTAKITTASLTARRGEPLPEIDCREVMEAAVPSPDSLGEDIEFLTAISEYCGSPASSAWRIDPLPGALISAESRCSRPPPSSSAAGTPPLGKFGVELGDRRLY